MRLISFFPSDDIRNAYPASAPAPRLYADISQLHLFAEGGAKTLLVLCSHARELAKHFSVLPVQETRALRQPPISLASLIFGRYRRSVQALSDLGGGPSASGVPLKQYFAMSSNGCGTFAGNLGSFLSVLFHAGGRFVSASTSVIPSDQISPLGDIAPLHSRAQRTRCRSPEIPPTYPPDEFHRSKVSTHRRPP